MFLEEVQVMTIDPQKLAQLERLTQTSYIFADWIKLISMFKLNQNWRKVDQKVLKMEERFLLKETLLLRETQEKIARSNLQKREDILEVFALFEKGLNHGEYTQLAEKLATFAILMYQDKHITLSLAQSKLEYLISMFKDNIKNGSLYFNRLRKLYKIKQTPDQTIKIRRAYQRQLALPFESMDVTLDQYKNCEQDEQQIKKTQATYEANKGKLDQTIEDIRQKRLENLPPKTALSILQTENSFDENVYLSIMNKLPLQEQLLILKKQSKVGRFFELYLKQLIKHHPEQEQLINNQFHRFLAVCSKKHIQPYQRMFLETIVKRLNKHLIKQQPQQYLEAWPNKLIYFRHKITNFIDATTQNSRKLELYSFWADVEAYVVKDHNSTINISKLELQLTKEAIYYIRFANRLITLGKFVEALHALKDGRKVCSNPQLLTKEYARFKALFGIEDDVEDNVAETEENNYINDIFTHNSKPTPQKKRSMNHDHQTPVENLKRSREDDAQQQFLHQKIEQQQRKRHHTDGGRTILVKGLNPEWKQKDVIELFNNREAIVEARIVRDKSGRSKGFCYVDFATQEDAQAECQQSRTDGITFNINRPPKQYSEERTIFLCALPASATDQKVRDMLGEQLMSHIDEVRLLKNEEQSRGYCYVQFETIEAKAKAFEELLHKKLSIDGKRILIEQCDNNRQKSKKLNQVIFLDGLAYKADEQDIRDFFQHHKLNSSITAIEIPKKNDKSIGTAYVEFSKYIDFQRALDLHSGRIHHRDFKILRSDRKITYQKQDRSQKQAASNQKPLTNEDFSKLFQK